MTQKMSHISTPVRGGGGAVNQLHVLNTAI